LAIELCIVVEENQNYADVVASPSMPYLNILANQYGLAANYFANGHPSIPNYFELTTGQTLTIIDALTPGVVSRFQRQCRP
jgi:acid phosphatase